MHCDNTCRQSEQSDVDAEKPAANLPKSESSGYAQKPFQLQSSNQSFPGTRTLFALKSMAKRMSPVLSSYVRHQQHEPATQQHEPATQQHELDTLQCPGDGADTPGGESALTACSLHQGLLQMQA